MAVNRPAAYGCLSGLLTRDPEYDREWALRFERRVPGDVVHPRTPSVHVLSINGTDLVYRCEGQPESRVTVVSGV